MPKNTQFSLNIAVLIDRFGLLRILHTKYRASIGCIARVLRLRVLAVRGREFHNDAIFAGTPIAAPEVDRGFRSATVPFRNSETLLERLWMQVENFETAVRALPQRRALGWRHGFGLCAAATDALVVILVVAATSIAYHQVAYGHTGSAQITAELAGMLSALFVFINAMRGRYQIGRYLSIDGQVGSAFRNWTMTLVALVAIIFLAKIVDQYSRAVVLATYLAGIPTIAGARALIVRSVVAASRAGRMTTERTVLIGREAQVMAFVADHKPWQLGIALVDVCFLPERSGLSSDEAKAALAEDLAAAVANCRTRRPDSIYVALPWSERETIAATIDAFMTLPVAIHLAPEPVIERFGAMEIVRAGSLATLRVARPALTVLEVAAKRAFDLVAASVLLLLLAPVLVLIALLIRLDSPGPVLFLQRRYGFNQQAFRIFKFRTMTTTDDGAVVVQARRNDPRITRIGSVLRRYNLDELPQLLNVIAGQMSLVGPRPHALAHDIAFQREIALYARRHNVKPGITGWAQVNGLRGETDTPEKITRRIAFDLWYIDNWSFMLDLFILLRTLSPKAFSNAR